MWQGDDSEHNPEIGLDFMAKDRVWSLKYHDIFISPSVLLEYKKGIMIPNPTNPKKM